MKILKITGGEVLLDDEDYDDVAQFNWYVHQGRYAKRNITLPSGKQTHQLLHNYVMHGKIPEGKVIDHKNRNKLDNTKENFRFCTNAQNCQNANRTVGVSKFRGVCKLYDKWRARAMTNGKRISLGIFNNAIDAAKAYDAHILKTHGEFALLNFPSGQRQG